jgi:Cdc6-like AAA superfamily ATPase
VYPAKKDIIALFSTGIYGCGESEISPEDFDKLDRDKQISHVERLRELHDPRSFTAPENTCLEELARRFSLNKEHSRLTVFLFLFERYTRFQRWFSDQLEGMNVRLMEEFTGLARNDLVEALRPSGMLSESGILDPDGKVPIQIQRYNIKTALSPIISGFLDDTHTRSLTSFILETPRKDGLPISAFDLPIKTVRACRATLRTNGRGIILVYGESGTGKTGFASRICTEAGKKPCFLKPTTVGSRYAALRIAAKIIDNEIDTLVIDESEPLLSVRASSSERASLLAFLDDYDKKIVLIVNDLFGIGESILGRIDSFVAFKPPTSQHRERIWNEIDQASPVFAPERRTRIAMEFPASPARIRQVHDICSVLASEGCIMNEIEDSARDLLSRGIEAMTGDPYRNETVSEDIDLSLIVSSIPANELVERARRWNGEKGKDKRGLNLLFYGSPGTGKTAFARYLARELGYLPMIRRASELLGQYVGMTERLIREMFEEAKGACLIIDEADSFLSERSAAIRTWERTQVNEFLTCMESFTGLFIATTNFTTLLDVASRRRFQYKVEFGPATPPIKRALATRFFPDMDWTEATLERVSEIEGLTPGDFNAVAGRLRYAGDVTATEVYDELSSERRFGRTNMPIGFSS